MVGARLPTDIKKIIQIFRDGKNRAKEDKLKVDKHKMMRYNNFTSNLITKCRDKTER